MSEPSLADVLASAAALQRAVPDAVLVGGTAAALHAGHRTSFDHDHDHVLSDLAERYAEVLAAVEATGGWVTSVAGLRQLRRTRPLEVEEWEVGTADDGGGAVVRVPTLPEMLRVKAYLVVQRNQVRDYLDTVALADRLGGVSAVSTMAGIDEYYRDRSGGGDSVLTALVQRLSEPAPRDSRVTRQLSSYRALDQRWHDWSAVVAACQELADGLLEHLEGDS